MDTTLNLSSSALRNVQRWLGDAYDESTKQQIRLLLEKDLEKAEDAFYTTLSFGTGGIRGLMGIGSNRINAYTIRELTQGLVDHMLHSAIKKPKLVIAYDTRNNSRYFAEQAAHTASSNGIETFLFDTCCPTPLLSFAVRNLSCHAGIMITASHNPPEYNGFKVYWSDGAQVLPPHDMAIAQEVERIRSAGLVAVHCNENSPYTVVGREVIHAYLQKIKKLQLWPSLETKNDLRILYSSLHGTGGVVMEDAFSEWGMPSVGFVHQQMVMDGNFPTTRTPNPEIPQALSLGTEQLIKEGYDLLLATDPDADRVGVVIRHKGKAYPLTGNQVGAIMAEWILKRLYEEGRLQPKPAIIKTIVTSPLLKKIATYWNTSCFDVLTGFKYIAEKIRLWETDPERGFSFVFGGEESLGYLYGTNSRDKDGVLSACVIAEIAAYFKKQKKTLVDALQDIWKKYGVFVEQVKTVAFPETKEGRESMTSCMARLRKDPPTSVGGLHVEGIEDLLHQSCTEGLSCRIASGLPISDVLLFHLEGGGIVCIRPSGTEPKVKIYAMVCDQTKGRIKSQIHLLEKQIEHIFHEIGQALQNASE